MKVFNKLVRDKIPEIIRKNGEKPRVKILDDENYIKELNKKLKEEVNEFLAEESVEELADVLEVVYSLAEANNYGLEKLECVRKEKAEKRGAFKDRVFLESTN